MPGYSAREDALVTKLVSFFTENEKHGLPSHVASILHFDATTGVLKAVSYLNRPKMLFKKSLPIQFSTLFLFISINIIMAFVFLKLFQFSWS